MANTWIKKKSANTQLVDLVENCKTVLPSAPISFIKFCNVKPFSKKRKSLAYTEDEACIKLSKQGNAHTCLHLFYSFT